MTEFIDDSVEQIAIIGMSGRFPGAGNIDQFWQNLCEGRETITFLTEQELIDENVSPSLFNLPNYVKAVPKLEDIDRFDARFFGISPIEAQLMDPQHRLFLECAWSAMEDAAYVPEKLDGLTSVFAGSSTNTYILNNLWSNRDLLNSVGSVSMTTANSHDYLATRVSYRLNLNGSSFNVQSACSTSLLATHLACQHLLTYQCDMAIAGGVSVFSEATGYFYEEGSIQSPDGHVRPFDANAKGTVFGNAVGAVVLKRLSEAIADGDQIYAVIRGSASNNDGAAKVGFTAPGRDGQVQAILMAQMAADVTPDSIDYIEAHGTGTVIGDPIEVDALTQAFQTGTERTQFCAIGSVKGNIGHTDAAAGITSLIKTALALKHGKMPPSINYNTPNPAIDFESGPFFVNTELRDWQRNGHPRRAGVSSFGIGGTNVHAVLEEAPSVAASATAERRHQLITQAARTETALLDMEQTLRDHLAGSPQMPLADVAYTLTTGRSAFDVRSIAVAASSDDLIALLDAEASDFVSRGVATSTTDSVAFLFSGQGSQHVNMGRDLYEHEAVYRQSVDHCAQLLTPLLGLDIRSLLFPAAGDEERATEQLMETRYTQPALFITEYALAQLWASLGVRPNAVMGHSIGEYAAACVAGVFGVEDALKLVTARGRLMQSMAPGSMMAVMLDEETLRNHLPDNVSLAAINGVAQCTVAGPTDAIDALEGVLSAENIVCRRLRTSHAFHSAMMEPMLDAFAQVVATVTLNAPQMGLISNVTGDWISAEQATNPAYWVSHVRAAVRFAQGIELLTQTPNTLLLEVGPGTSLKTLAQRHASRSAEQAVVASMRHPRESHADDAVLLKALGQLWLAGYAVDWAAFYGDAPRQRVSLPTYPFERQRYWVEPTENGTQSSTTALLKNNDLAQWFYIPSWQRSVPPVAERQDEQTAWLIFANDDALGSACIELLGGDAVTTVFAGDSFTQNANRFTLDPNEPEHYDALWDALKEAGRLPTQIVHLWNATTAQQANYPLWRSFYSLMYLAQTLGKQTDMSERRLTIVSSEMQRVVSSDLARTPEKALLTGPTRVIAQEMPHIATQSIDFATVPDDKRRVEQRARQLLAEVQAARDEKFVAYHGSDRWVQTYEMAPLDSAETVLDTQLRQHGVYFITGGLGGIGLTFANFLAETEQAKLVLTSRSEFPARDTWAQWLETHDTDDRMSVRIAAVQKLEAAGAEVLVVAADISDGAAMQAAVDAAVEQFGRIDGVVHAAGLPGGGIIQMKTREVADRVLTPKVTGTQTLFAALGDLPLDFVMLCSSVTAVTGGFGQVDYCAGNAYLDAFAREHNGHNGVHVVSVNWDAWSEVGMAVNTARNFTGDESETRDGTPIEHPLLETRYDGDDGDATYELTFDPDKHWVLSDHSVLDVPTAPGTTHLELARAAFSDFTQQDRLLLPDVIFLSPLQVNEGARKLAQLKLSPNGGAHHFSVQSQGGVAANGDVKWDTHVDGSITALPDDAVAPQYNLDEIIGRCTKDDLKLRGDEFQGMNGIRFGEHWHLLRRVFVGENEALARIELKPELQDDLDALALHPAIIDIATSFSIGVDADELHLPLSYRNLRLYEPLPATVYSYIRRDADAVGKQTVVFKVSLLAEDGRTLAEVEEFTMKRVGQEAAGRIREESGTEDDSAEVKNPIQLIAMSPDEGVEVFKRVLARNRLPQIAVVTRHLPTLIRQMANPAQNSAQRALPIEKVARPTLSEQYVAPRNEIEAKVAEIWQDVLGLETVGVNDNLFDLGGDSLLAIQFGSRLTTLFNVSVPVRTILENPSVAELSKALAELTGDLADGEGRFEAIPRRENSAEPAPLSMSQQRLWIVNQLHAPSAAYNLSQRVRLEGQLDIAQLERAIAQLLDRHDMLRTVIRADEATATPYQVMLPELEIALERADVSSANGSTEQMLESIISEHIQRLFDLENGPLVRLLLVRESAESHILQLCIHHIISDATSVNLMVRDLLMQYEGQPLPELPIQYADYAVWQREQGDSDAMVPHLAYWKEQLDGIPTHLKLPTDFPRPAEQSFAGDFVPYNISPELTKQVRAFSRRHQVTVYTTLLVAFNMLMARYSGETDIVIGAASSGRYRPESQDMVGFFVNNLVLRSDLAGNPNALTLLQQAEQTLREAQQHEQVPFEQIIDVVNPVRDFSYSPLFQTMLIYVPTSEEGMTMSQLKPSIVTGHAAATQYDITLMVAESEERIIGIWEYCTALFTKETAQQMLTHFQNLLRALTATPEVGYEQLPMLASAEIDQLTQTWNDTTTAYHATQTVTQLFETQAAATPERTAATFGSESLSYATLNQRANQLARHLQAQGVAPGDLVGIHLQRSLNQIVALLAVGKTGAAYVPLDPAFPAQRLAYMVEDCGMQLLLSDAPADAPLLQSVRTVVRMGANSAEFEHLSDDNLNLNIDPQTPAYVIYTSGSTGMPKGVVVPHKALVNFLSSMAERPGLASDDVLLSVTTLSFDIAGLEMYLPLIRGAQLVIADTETVVDGRALAQTLVDANITVLQATPATWRLLIDAEWQGKADLKMLCGGEPLPQQLAAQLLPLGQSLWNMYGPTETTIWSTVAQVTPDESVHIGTPIANTQVFVLDEQQQPTPVGVAGTLWIAGDGVASGYLNRPDLTANRFVNSKLANGIMYNTGDMARWNRNGTLSCLGRKDQQVKVRGFRIELGEIESRMEQHLGVTAAAVAVSDNSDDKRLVGYWVAGDSAQETVSAESMRSWLAQTLPLYMIPFHLAPLDALPLTPNGKVDRLALAQRSITGTNADQYVAPQTELEQTLATLWEELLNVPQVGMQDNFFSLGGHSLTATQLVTRIRQQFGVEIKLRDLFFQPTVAALTAQVETAQDASNDLAQLEALLTELE